MGIRACIGSFWMIACLVPSLLGQSPAGDCVALQFYTPGCPQCARMDEAAHVAIDQGWAVRRVNVVEDPFTAKRWRIHNTPTTLLIRDGRETDRILGPVTANELIDRMIDASSGPRQTAAARTMRPMKEMPPAAPAMATLTPNLVAPNSSMVSPAAFAASQIQREVPPSARMASRDERMASPSEPSVHLTQTSASVAPASFQAPSTMSLAAATAGAIDPKERARRATVRIRVEEPNSHAVGTGSIIDAVQGEALVITCGHLFRDLGPNPTIFVECFDLGQPVAYAAQLIYFEAGDRDIGLIAFRPGREVTTVPILPRTSRIQSGETVFSMGCDQGSDPTRRDTRVTKLCRYIGAPNISIDGMPVQGRSGGGLFNASGELVGVCNFADPDYEEGLYGGTEIIYEQVSKLGLERLLDSRPSAVAAVAPQPPRSSQSITVVLRESNGMERQVKIQDPSPALLQALASEGLAVAR